MSYATILYYKYVDLPDPEAERLAQRELCARLGLKGRILLASEGINGAVAGTADMVDAYIQEMNQHTQFHDIEYKRDECTKVPFPRLRIKVRPEIVTLGVPADVANTGTKLTPAEFHALADDPNVILFDARNDYESAIGRFRGAITPAVRLFKDLPTTLGEYEDLKDKKIITYCTGGIRCEKVSALMKERGFKDVYQLDGGIIKYAKQYPDGKFEGECFVFDERMSVAFKADPENLGTCHFCAAPTNTYRNCAVPTCNDLILICSACVASGRSTCIACLDPVLASAA